jgi:hypothetical protein
MIVIKGVTNFLERRFEKFFSVPDVEMQTIFQKLERDGLSRKLNYFCSRE